MHDAPRDRAEDQATMRIRPEESGQGESSEEGAGGDSTDHLSEQERGNGVQLEGYDLRRRLAGGGQATVWEAIQQATGRKVAVKILHEGSFGSEDARRRFDREVRILAALDHPNIVKVVDRGRTTFGADYLVMDYVQGRSLDGWLEAYYVKHPGGPPPESPAQVLQLFLKICDAVHAAHIRGIVHRDLKPGNLMVDDSDEPHILDFGLAREGLEPVDRDGKPGVMTMSGQFLGSLPWASPEQAEGQQSKVDIRSDVYALGVILCQMLTGHFPYEVRGSMPDVLKNIISTPPTPPSELIRSGVKGADPRRDTALRRASSALNPVVDAIVLKALSKKREDRYQSAGELAKEIVAYLGGRPTLASGDAYGRAGRRGPVLIAAGIIIIAAIAAGIWWLNKGSSPPSTPSSAIEETEPDASVAGAVKVPSGDVQDTAAVRGELPFGMTAAEIESNLKVYRKRIEMVFPGQGARLTLTPDGRLIFELSPEFNPSETLNLELLRLMPLSELILVRRVQGSREWIPDLDPLSDLQLRRFELNHSVVDDLRPLQGHPLSHLVLANTDVADLAPIEGMPLEYLDLTGSKVVSLSPLAGAPLSTLILDGNPVRYLDALSEMRLRELQLNSTKIMDIESLRGLPLQHLEFAYTRVVDLSPLQGMPLKQLTLDGCWQIEDFTPLKGLPLEYLDVSSTKVRDLGILEGMALRTLMIHNSAVISLSALEGLPLTHLVGIRPDIKDLSPLATLPLKSLDMPGYIGDLSALADTSLEALNLFDATVPTLEPLRGLPLKRLIIQHVDVKDSDLSPLYGNAELRELHVSGDVISHAIAAQASAITVDEFLKSAHALIEGFREVPGFLAEPSPVYPGYSGQRIANRMIKALEELKVISSTGMNGGPRYFLCPLYLTWDEANRFCESVGAHLATIAMAEEANYLDENLHPNEFRIGGAYAAEKGGWHWVTGEPWGYERWGAGPPASVKERESLMVVRTAWSASSPEHRSPFVMEWEEASIPY